MNERITKTVKFNGKTIIYTEVNGIDYIALKPVCEVLGVDYVRQFKNTKKDITLAPALSKHKMKVSGDQGRKYICLTEEYIYGWIFSIHSKSEALQRCKIECYHVLYSHFHGYITQRKKLIKERVSVTAQRKEVEELLFENDDFVQWLELKAEEARIGKNMKQQDENELNNQLSLLS